MKGRARVRALRNILANKRLLVSKERARCELAACRIQVAARQYLSQCTVSIMIRERDRLKARWELEDRRARIIQRVFRGSRGRQIKREILAFWKVREMSLDLLL
jgi:hypothetical protein